MHKMRKTNVKNKNHNLTPIEISELGFYFKQNYFKSQLLIECPRVYVSGRMLQVEEEHEEVRGLEKILNMQPQKTLLQLP